MMEILKELEKYRLEIENFNVLALPIQIKLIPFQIKVLPFDYTILVKDLEKNTVVAKLLLSYDGKNLQLKGLEIKI